MIMIIIIIYTIIRHFYIKYKYIKYLKSNGSIDKRLTMGLSSSLYLASNVEDKTVSVWDDDDWNRVYTPNPLTIQSLRNDSYRFIDNIASNKEIIQQEFISPPGKFRIIEKRNSDYIPQYNPISLSSSSSSSSSSSGNGTSETIYTISHTDFDVQYLDLSEEIVHFTHSFICDCLDNFQNLSLSVRVLDELDNILKIHSIDHDRSLTLELMQAMDDIVEGLNMITLV